MLRFLTALFALGLVGCATVEERDPVYIEPFTIVCDEAPVGEVAQCREAYWI